MRNKYRMISAIVCIAIGMSACSHLRSINVAPSVEAETAQEEHISVDLETKDADWLLVSNDTADGKHIQTYAYRGCPSGGERIIFNPVIEVFSSGLSEEDFSEIHTSIYSQSVYWLERMDIPEREDTLNLEPDETGKISDDTLEKAYEIFLFLF
ncbi:MAG: hypothetical protein LUE86_07775 [Clostridiales bacterium]|nr:hypothetical protein [Clostridiales bacterium]